MTAAFYTTEQIDHCARQILHAEHAIPVTHEQVLTMWHAMPEESRDAYRKTALARLGDYASMTHEERASANRAELEHVLRPEPHTVKPHTPGFRVVPPHRSGGGCHNLQPGGGAPHMMILDDPYVERSIDPGAPNGDETVILVSNVDARDRAALEAALQAELDKAGVKARILVDLNDTSPDERKAALDILTMTKSETTERILREQAERNDKLARVKRDLQHTATAARAGESSLIAGVPMRDMLLGAGHRPQSALEAAIGAMDPAARAHFERSIDAVMPGEVEARWDIPGPRLKRLKDLERLGEERRTRAFWLHCIDAIALDERDELAKRQARRATKLAAAEAKRERRRQRNKALRSAR